MISCLSLIVWMIVCLSVGFLGSVFTASSVGTWYQTLHRPWFTPPDAVFAPVWTVLYVVMAIAAWMVWRERKVQAINGAMIFFVLQLLLNFAWSWIFFGLRRPDLAFFEIVVLWLSIVATAFAFRRINAFAFVLWLPYLLWVSFAAVLNLSFWVLNPSLH